MLRKNLGLVYQHKMMIEQNIIYRFNKRDHNIKNVLRSLFVYTC